MKRLRWLSVLVLVVGCGNNQPPQLNWPAQIVSVKGFSDDQNKSLQKIVATLNTQEGKQVLGMPGDTIAGSPISVELVDSLDDSQSTSSMASTTTQCAGAIVPSGADRFDSTTTRVAGRATVSTDNCAIQFSSFVVEGAYDLFEAVGVHEFGHCAGLVHVAPTLQVMSPVTVPFSQYTPDALRSFFASFIKSARM